MHERTRYVASAARTEWRALFWGRETRTPPDHIDTPFHTDGHPRGTHASTEQQVVVNINNNSARAHIHLNHLSLKYKIAAAPTFHDGPFASARKTAQDVARPTMMGRSLSVLERQATCTRQQETIQAPGSVWQPPWSGQTAVHYS